MAKAEKATKIFVGRLPTSCKKAEIEELFGKYGTVKECDILSNYGFVHMGSAEEAETAIKALHNYEIDGAKITVEESTSRPRSKMPRSRGGGRGRRLIRNGYGPIYQAHSWDRYGGRSHPYPELYDDRRFAPPLSTGYGTGYDEDCFNPPLQSKSTTDSRYSSDAIYNQYDPYGGPPSWSNFSGRRPSPPTPRRTF